MFGCNLSGTHVPFLFLFFFFLSCVFSETAFTEKYSHTLEELELAEEFFNQLTEKNKIAFEISEGLRRKSTPFIWDIFFLSCTSERKNAFDLTFNYEEKCSLARIIHVFYVVKMFNEWKHDFAIYYIIYLTSNILHLISILHIRKYFN